jgi:hypothetical protein
MIRRTVGVVFVVLALMTRRAGAQMTDVLTFHNDNGRTGQQLHEEILSPANVTNTHFGLLRVYPTDGRVDAQPLYAAGVTVPGQGEHNLLFVATEHDSVYAFNADGTNVYWKVSLLGGGETTSDDRGCTQVTPEIGITATPVIDRGQGPNGAMFVVAMSKNGSGTYIQRLHALDLATGTDLVSAVTIAATYTGSGATNLVFASGQYKERPGLLLSAGIVYTAWSSHCDITPYQGWIIGYNEQTLTQVNVLNIDPNGSEGAIWMAGDGLATDASNNIYFLDANGTFDTNLTVNGFPNRGDFGNAFIKLSTTSNVLAVADYSTMTNTVAESNADEDLGSGGELVLPDLLDGLGQTHQLAVGAGKDGIIYLADRNDMGKFSPTTNAIYQEVSGALGGSVYSTPAYFNGTLYYGAVGDHIGAFPFVNARLTARSSQSAGTFAYPGATPDISANGASNGIVWATQNTTPVVLHAYNATNLAVELYNSNQAAAGRDHFGIGNKFITPTIASACVYVGGSNSVGAFGLLDQTTLTPIEVWRDNNFGNPSNVGAGSDTATPASDGVPNLLKYALGLNPFTPVAPGNYLVESFTTNSGLPYLTLTINRSANPTDITDVVEVSGDLQTWLSGPPNTVILTNTSTQLIVRDNTPANTGTNRFIHLRVTNP